MNVSEPEVSSMVSRSQPSTKVGDPPAKAPVAACRVVTTSESVRLLLSGQLKALSEIEWTVVSGDECPGPLPGVRAVRHVPMRRDLSASDARSAVSLYRFFRRHRFAFVQTHTPKASLLGLPAARLAGLPTLYTMHGSLFFRENALGQNVLAWPFEWWCCAWAKRVLVQSREDAKVLPRAGICRSSKIVHIGNGIDLSRYVEAALPVVAGGRPVVLMISRLVAEKGVRDFFLLAKALHGRARFIHAGPTEADQRDAISDREIEEVAAKGHVEFLGPVADVRPHLAGCHLLTLPSYREGIPRVAMEAAAMARPVAGYDIRGLREVIPGHLGLLTRRGDVQALIELVGRLVDAPDQLVPLGQACRRHVVAGFSEDGVVERLRPVYARLDAPA